MAQKIVDLDAAVPEKLHVRVEGEVYDLPGDIPIPDYIELERLVEALNDPEADGSGTERMQELYERVLELFQIYQPEIEKLPIGPRRLGVLMVSLYTGGGEGDPEDPKAGAGTKSSNPRKRSRGSKQ